MAFLVYDALTVGMLGTSMPVDLATASPFFDGELAFAVLAGGFGIKVMGLEMAMGGCFDFVACGAREETSTSIAALCFVVHAQSIVWFFTSVFFMDDRNS